ncbi:hypothetical protein CYLTODRAFT_420226 [Cylindrobasidium torrendii FP15055 ss-10]|uniref:Kinetochore protein SPC25 n=1 Tax=Cylindrobasidium torrendii FP15055 ss-10 TaxID=1314674 RepID=A0A0D7BJW6_9AGAR|nr:hypothetical protein CYLTODRAFT_420226 [Cylindrobasidium torrendii FP15055 ss-10]
MASSRHPTTWRRPPRISTAELIASGADSVDLHKDAFRERSKAFMEKLVAYKTRIFTEENEARASLTETKAKLQAKARDIEAETQVAKAREIAMIDEMAKEREEMAEAEAAVAGVKKQLVAAKAKLADLEREADHFTAIVDDWQQVRQREQSILESSATAIQPDIQVLESALGCVIEGMPNEHILIRFWNIDPSQPDRECTFVIDPSGPQYIVPSSSPRLPSMGILVDRLNDNGDVFGFIILVRQAFAKLFSPS